MGNENKNVNLLDANQQAQFSLAAGVVMGVLAKLQLDEEMASVGDVVEKVHALHRTNED